MNKGNHRQEKVEKSHANKMENKAQQEMVGFVLIVVIVVVAMMVFLVFSLRSSSEGPESVEVSNMLKVMMAWTTECNGQRSNVLDDLSDLFQSCFENKKCSSLGTDSCEYLNETIGLMLEDIMASEPTITAYELEFSERDSLGSKGIFKIFEGNCTNSNVYGAQETINSEGENLVISLRICKKEN